MKVSKDSYTFLFPAAYHQYWLTSAFGDEDEVRMPEPVDIYTARPLLHVTQEGRVGDVTTGVQYGDVELTVRFFEQAPPVDTAVWDEVMEVSMRLGGEIILWNPDNDSTEIPLPDEGRDPAWWRVRLHTTGSGETPHMVYASDGDEVVEKHLLQIWPAPRASDAHLKGEPPNQDEHRANMEEYARQAGLGAGAWPVPLDRGDKAITLTIGAGAPPAAEEGKVLTVAEDGSGLRIVTSGLRERALYANVTSRLDAPGSEFDGWEQPITFEIGTHQAPEGDFHLISFGPGEPANIGNLPQSASCRWHGALYRMVTTTAEATQELYELVFWPAD